MINQPLSWEAIRKYILQSDLLAEKPRLAVTGWADGSLSSPDRPNFIKVYFYDDKSEVEVANESAPLVRGIQVNVYKGFDGVLRARQPSRGYQVKDLWFSFIKNHAANHGAYNVDPIYVHTRSMLSFHPHVTGPWDISVKSGWMVFGDQVYWFPGETVSVQQHRASGGGRFVLLSAGLETIDGVKTVKMIVTPGLQRDTLVAPNDFPKIPAGTSPICAVRTRLSRTKLQDKQVDGDIHDLRLSGGVGSGTATSARTEAIIFDEQLMIFNSDTVEMEV